MEIASTEKVKALNYDHAQRLAVRDAELFKQGKLDALRAVDDRSYRALLSAVPKNRLSVLELGASNGRQFPLIQEWSPFGTIFGIELHEPSVKIARAAGRCVMLGFIEDMAMFDDNSFDLVCSRHVMEHVGDLEKAVFEILRVTKPGGYIAQVTPDLQIDHEPAHLTHMHLQEWASYWLQTGVKLNQAKFRPDFHGGEVHIVGQR